MTRLVGRDRLIGSTGRRLGAHPIQGIDAPLLGQRSPKALLDDLWNEPLLFAPSAVGNHQYIHAVSHEPGHEITVISITIFRSCSLAAKWAELERFAWNPTRTNCVRDSDERTARPACGAEPAS